MRAQSPASLSALRRALECAQRGHAPTRRFPFAWIASRPTPRLTKRAGRTPAFIMSISAVPPAKAARPRRRGATRPRRAFPAAAVQKEPLARRDGDVQQAVFPVHAMQAPLRGVRATMSPPSSSSITRRAATVARVAHYVGNGELGVFLQQLAQVVVTRLRVEVSNPGFISWSLAIP